METTNRRKPRLKKAAGSSRAQRPSGELAGLTPGERKILLVLEARQEGALARKVKNIRAELVKSRESLSTSAAVRQREATNRYRANMRKQGMKLVQLWVPDVNAPGFAEECRRQSALIAKDAADPTSEEALSNRELDAWAAELDASEPDYDWGPEGPPK